MIYNIKYTSKFKKDLKLAKKQNKDLNKLYHVIDQLSKGRALDLKYKDHELSGEYKGVRSAT